MSDSRNRVADSGIGANPLTTATGRIAGKTAKAEKKLRAFDVNKLAAVFPDRGHRLFAVDALSIFCAPVHGAIHPPIELRPGVLRYLLGRGRLRYVKSRLVVIRLGGFKAVLGVGRDSWMRCRLHVNIMRRLRDKLRNEGLYPRKHRVSGASGDNFIDPSVLAPGVDLHARAIEEVHLALAEARQCYRRLVEALFSSIDLEIDQVRVAISRIELTWDVPSRLARAMPTLWQRAWCSVFPAAAIEFGEFTPDDEAHLRDGNEGPTSASSLRAKTSGGSSCIMYPKHDDEIRFEERHDNRRMGRMLGGRPIRLDTVEDLAEDLETLAAPAYSALLEAQENLLSKRVLDPVELLKGFYEAGKKAFDILDVFLAGAQFHHVGKKYDRELRELRRRGWARIVGRGLWAAGPALHRSLGLLQWMRSCGEGPT